MTTNFSYEGILSAMRERYRELAGFEADDASDIGIRLRVLAEQVHILCENALELEKQAFAQTAQGSYLDMHAQTRGITRKEAVPSAGVLRFKREIPAVSDIHIEAGIICATRPSPQIRFETAGEAVLPTGQTEVLIPARALDFGAAGNVAAGSVCVMVSSAPGISGVDNPAAFAGGVDAESDDDLRERLLASYRNISNGANRAFYYDLAMGREGVASVNVIPRARGRGTVDVVIVTAPEAAQAAIIAELQSVFSEKREVNVDVQVRAAQIMEQPVSLLVEPQAGNSYELVAANCLDAVRGHLNSLGVGEVFILARLGVKLMAVEGVKNYRLLSPASDVIPTDSQVIRAGGVSVARLA